MSQIKEDFIDDPENDFSYFEGLKGIIERFYQGKQLKQAAVNANEKDAAQ